MKHQQGHSRAGSNRQLESIAKSQAFGGAFPLQKKNIFFSFYLTKAELLALTAADFNFDKETVTINKSYQRLHVGSQYILIFTAKNLVRKLLSYCPSNFICGIVW